MCKTITESIKNWFHTKILFKLIELFFNHRLSIINKRNSKNNKYLLNKKKLE